MGRARYGHKHAAYRAAVLLLLAPLLGAVAGLFALPDDARAQVPPDAEWRTVATEHFRVTYPAGLDSLGARAAVLAEHAWDGLSEALVEPPDAPVEVLLTDFADVSNGFATVVPFPRIVIYARPPIDGLNLSHFDDWLELVIVHELAHVFHLDVTGPLGGVLRRVFGRVASPWPFFPHFALPTWTIEGLATWYESDLTTSGRVRGTYHDMVLRTAVLEDEFASLAQASGRSPAWPGGQRPYVYGSLFFDWLIETYGREQVGEFLRTYAGFLVPYLPGSAAREAFGVPFDEAWEMWRGALERETAALADAERRRAPLTEPEVVVRGARTAFYPRTTADGAWVLYARSDGLDDPQLAAAPADGAAPGERTGLARTNGVATFSLAPGGRIVFSQLEFVDPYRLRADLFEAVLEERGGVAGAARAGAAGVAAAGAPEVVEIRRITEGARLDHPSVAPDGRTAVAVELTTGSTALVEVDLASGATRSLVPRRPGVHWAFPAVSPDGERIAVARWSTGSFFDIVLLDREGRVVGEVTRDRALDTAPAWSPDGRWLLWASDRSGIPNVLAARLDPATGDVGPALQATHLLTGAAFPSVSPDGRQVYFSAYHADGWTIERTPFAPETWPAAFDLDPRFAGEYRAPEPAASLSEPRPYSALRTLRPRHWEPGFRAGVEARGRTIVEPSLGVLTSGQDLVGRHAVSAALYLSLGDARPSGALSWTWAGLGNPLLGVTVAQAYDGAGPFGIQADTLGRRFWVEERERAIAGTATLRRQRYRSSASLGLGAGLVQERRRLLDDDLEESTEFALNEPESRLADLRATLAWTNARAFAFSVGVQEGVSAFLRGRTRRELGLVEGEAGVAGADRSLNDVVGQVRAYTGFGGPGYADHVLALRLSGGAGGGPGADAFHFDAGGTSGGAEPISGLGLVGGSGYLFPARGYVNGSRAGRWAWSASGEYRFPLALVDAGWALVPLHVDRVSGTLFADAANAWGPEPDNARGDPLASVGGEVVTELLTFFQIPLTLRLGVAVPLLDRAPGARPGTSVYLRFGRSF